MHALASATCSFRASTATVVAQRVPVRQLRSLAENGTDSIGTQQSQGVLSESTIAVEADFSGRQVVAYVKGIDNFGCRQVIGHGVDGKVPPLQICLDAGAVDWGEVDHGSG